MGPNLVRLFEFVNSSFYIGFLKFKVQTKVHEPKISIFLKKNSFQLEPAETQLEPIPMSNFQFQVLPFNLFSSLSLYEGA